MTYAIGRRVEYFDMPAVRTIIREAAANDHRMSSYILGVVFSAPFRMSRADGLHPPRPRFIEQESPMYVTNKYLSRRAVLRGMGATVALPYLSAMLPARKLTAGPGAMRTRFVAIEMVHGAAGSNTIGIQKNLWAPAAVGPISTSRPRASAPLEPFRQHVTIVSNTDCRNAEAFTSPEIGGDHFRSSSVFLTQSHPTQTEGSDVHVGTSLDQIYAQRFGQETPIPSMQLAIENVDQAGGCSYGYACVYMDTISWASPTGPLPMIRDPRLAFDQLFGSGGTPEKRAARRRAQQEHPRLDPGRGRAAEEGPRLRGPHPARRLPPERPRDRAEDPEDRGAQRKR